MFKFAALTLSLLLSLPSSAEAESRSYSFAQPPVVSREFFDLKLGLYKSFLKRELPAEFFHFSSYCDFFRAAANSEHDLYVLGPNRFVSMLDNHGYEPLVMSHQTLTFTVLSRKAVFRSLADLEGQRILLPHRQSNLFHLFVDFLQTQHPGVLDNTQMLHEKDNEDRSFMYWVHSNIDAVLLDSTLVQHLPAKQLQRYKRVDFQSRMPTGITVVSGQIEAEERARLQSVFVQASKDTTIAAELASVGVGNLVPIKSEDVALIRRLQRRSAEQHSSSCTP